MNYKQLLFGLATNVPGVFGLFSNTGGTSCARYCYSVWLRHLWMAHESGLLTSWPRDVAELGPGDSLGIGLAALISGVETYHAFDAVPFSDASRNLAIFDELVQLFRARQSIPDQAEFPLVRPLLKRYEFPTHILTEDWLANALAPARLGRIRNALAQVIQTHANTDCIAYVAPWNDPTLLAASTVDMLYSQAVLEHVDDLEAVYRSFAQWLRPTGWMSHDIDFTSHGIADTWSGQWAFSSRLWKLIRGQRPYLLNRQPLATHEKLINRFGFEIVREVKEIDRTGLSRDRLAPEFKDISEDDLITKTTFLQAVKK